MGGHSRIMALDAVEAHHRSRIAAQLARSGALGALAGTTWGVVARAWMRLISTAPEFSWNGTLAIIGLAALLGAGVGIAYAAGRTGRSPWFRLSIVPGLALFVSPGFQFAPAFLLGGLAWRNGRGSVTDRLLQLFGAAILIGIPIWVWRMGSFDEVTFNRATAIQQWTTGIGFFALGLVLALGGSAVWATASPPAD
jgi:hypothetical protein